MVSQVRTDYKTKSGCAKRAYGEPTMGHSDGSGPGAASWGREGVGGWGWRGGKDTVAAKAPAGWAVDKVQRGSLQKRREMTKEGGSLSTV